MILSIPNLFIQTEHLRPSMGHLMMTVSLDYGNCMICTHYKEVMNSRCSFYQWMENEEPIKTENTHYFLCMVMFQDFFILFKCQIMLTLLRIRVKVGQHDWIKWSIMYKDEPRCGTGHSVTVCDEKNIFYCTHFNIAWWWFHIIFWFILGDVIAKLFFLLLILLGNLTTGLPSFSCRFFFFCICTDCAIRDRKA